jgi:hypothetical protein
MPANIAAQVAAAQALMIAVAVSETEKLAIKERAFLAATTVEMLAEVNPNVHPSHLIVAAAAMWATCSSERKTIRRALRHAYSV